MNFGKFDRKLLLQKPAPAQQDAYGAPAPVAFEDVATVYGEQKYGAGTEANLGQELTAQQAVNWQIRYRREVVPSWQFTCEGRTYQITAVAEIGRRAGLLLTTYYRGEATAPVVVPPTPNIAPVASLVLLAGTAQVGSTLTSSYQYADAEGDPEGATLRQWYRASDATGTNRTAIAGATGATYELTPADLGSVVQVQVTPVALTGVLTGVATSSAYAAPVVAAPTPLVVQALGSNSGVGGPYTVGPIFFAASGAGDTAFLKIVSTPPAALSSVVWEKVSGPFAFFKDGNPAQADITAEFYLAGIQESGTYVVRASYELDGVAQLSNEVEIIKA